ncbi:MAG TPA: hypothetical protein VIG73_11150 [Cerasibacillus sp.]|uniref:hypothetical protein n=1 Tax=Cerasibacillus sp. TaxID=2498711 RepID=UPI002F4091A3
MTLIMAGIVLYIDKKTLRRINAQERKVYLTLVLFFIIFNIIEQKKLYVNYFVPVEWVYNKIPVMKNIYSFLENKG